MLLVNEFMQVTIGCCSRREATQCSKEMAWNERRVCYLMMFYDSRFQVSDKPVPSVDKLRTDRHNG